LARHYRIAVALSLLAALAASVAAVAWTATGPGRRGLQVATWRGEFQTKLRAVFFAPFTAATGIPITDVAWDGSVETLREMIQSPLRPHDLVLLDGPGLEQACEAGLVLRLDPAPVDEPADLVPGAVHRCGVAVAAWSLVLAWDARRFGDVPPGGWADLWDSARNPGTVALRRSPYLTLELALLGDGVAPTDVYARLATDAGVVQALARLEQLRGRVRWWRAGDQPAAWLADGSVAAAALFHDRLAAARAGGADAGTVPGAPLVAMDFVAIPKGADHPEEARRLIALMSAAEPQARFALVSGYGPVSRSAAARLPAERSEYVQPPVAGGLMVDAGFWAAHGPRLSAAFAAWLEASGMDVWTVAPRP